MEQKQVAAAVAALAALAACRSYAARHGGEASENARAGDRERLRDVGYADEAADQLPDESGARRMAVLEILESYRTDSGFPGAVAGVRLRDGASFAVACGVSDREARTPMREGDLLHAGSSGKTFFAALALQLVAEGELGLDERIARYVERESWFEGLPNGDTITVRMLLNHTSGLPQYPPSFMEDLVAHPKRDRDPIDGVRSLRGQTPLFAAGKRFAYSDLNYLVLAAVIETVTQRPAYESIRARLLVPLKLDGVVPADRPAIPGLVPGYAGASNPFGGDRMVVYGELVFHPRFEGGGGGFVVNARELARWMAAYCEGRAFDPKLLPEVLRGVEAPENGAGSRYGLGVHVDETPLGLAYGHGGYFPGYVTCVRWYAESRVSVALQLNTSDDAKIARRMTEVVDEIASALTQAPAAKAR